MEEKKLKEELKEVWDLLADVMQNPEHLTDSYYRDFGRELEKRYEELRANR